MKKSLVIIAAVVFLTFVSTVIVFAGGTKGEEGEADPLRGTWYGGSEKENHAGWKYQYTFIPTGPDRWTVIGDGAYNIEIWGNPIGTKWTGAIHKTPNGYRMRIMMMSQPDANIPPMEHPIVIAYQASIDIVSDSEITLTYRFGASYKLEQKPFIDAPIEVYKSLDDPTTVEYLQKLDTSGELQF
jgi:hypothetical protein